MSVPNHNEIWRRGAEEFRGQRLLPHVVDYHAHENPSRVFNSMPRTQNVADGFRDVDMKTMATAVDFMAWWLDDHSKSVPKEKKILAYLGVPDIRYPVLLFAAIKAGWTTFWISPRNPPDQNLHLLCEGKVMLLLHADLMEPVVKGIQQLDSAALITYMPVPSLEEVLGGQSHPYPYDVVFADVKDERCLAMHTSGSTGLPKIVSYTHAAFSCTDSDRNVPVPEGRRPQNAKQFDFSPPGRFYCCFPPFHVRNLLLVLIAFRYQIANEEKLAGTMAFMVIPVFSTTATAVFGPSTMPPSGHLVSAITKHTRVQALYIPPSTIEQWWTCDPDASKKAEGLNFVLFGGGPLAPSVGQKLSELTDLCQMYGSIESGQIQMLVPQPGEWQYLEPNPAEECDMQEVEEGSGLYELVLCQHEKFRGRRTLSHTFPDVKIWRTKDLFTPHPTKTGLWQFHSRTDDLIALGTSAKVFPVPMETALQGDPNVAGTLVVGNARPAVVLIIEPAQPLNGVSKDEFIDKIWAAVEEANAAAPTHGKVSRSRILLTDPAVGFARTPKGTISRKKSEALYTAAIDAVFRDNIVDENSTTSAF
ncbi:putative AMP dependent ligase/synthetase [Aspergillus bombycis]|uniref:Putative AMP dependent ligase/synthetase n=1 Tax=Aspergillus bombycis TaxID=109264 RepID=A0A1F8ADD1_9EURO|nr:putative AMP dependent ligase/synthetase [Aspergillus bombycis]OGM49661.1 putative AMP dependent ligase/synthetase [Aspergillus bombycis]